MTNKEQFVQERGIFVSRQRPHHRNETYDEKGFDMLIRMQREHFWYRGRHKLLLTILNKEIPGHFGNACALSAIDLGGGCGGWLEYLHTYRGDMFAQLALADSSMHALTLAEPVVGSFAQRYQVDLLDLPWDKKWDVVFILDVLEHIPDHREVLRQLRRSIRPGGLIFVTTPALQLFWTYNDDLVLHQRRYCKQDFRDLGKATGLELLRTDYFMFLLSPALLLSRMLFRPRASATPEELEQHRLHSHRIPAEPANEILTKIFSMEASMVNHANFPWGASLLALFRR